MRKFGFQFRYAFRNVTRNPFRTISLFLTFIMFSFILLVTFSIKDCIYQGYKLYRSIKNENIDVVISYDAYSTKHFVQTNKLAKLKKYISNWADVFIIPGSIGNEQLTGVSVMGSTTSVLEPFINQHFEMLKFDECLINENISKKLGINKGDELIVKVFKKTKVYKVAGVILVGSIVKNDTIVVDKSTLLRDFAEDLGLKFSIVGEIDLATNVYLKMQSDVKREELMAILASSDYYQGMVIIDPTNFDSVSSVIDMIVGALYAALVIFIFAIIFVFTSLMNLRIRQLKREMGIIETIGGSKKYIFSVLALEVFLLMLISIFVGYVIVSLIYTNTFKIALSQVSFNYHFSFWHFALCFLVEGLVVFLVIFRYYLKYQKHEILDLTKNNQYEKVISLKALIVICAILAFCELVVIIIGPYILPKPMLGLLTISLVSLLGLFLVSLIIKLICLWVPFPKVFAKIIKPSLAVNRIRHNSLKILLICFAGIIVALMVINTFTDLFNRIEKQINLNSVIVVPRGVSEEDEIIETVKNHPNVKNYTYGFLDTKLSDESNKMAFTFVLSCPIEDIKNIMSLELDNNYIAEFKNPEKQYVILNDVYMTTNHLKIGDHLTIVYTKGPVTYEILGTIHSDQQQYAYTNEIYMANAKPKVIIINNDIEDEKGYADFRRTINEKYGKDLCFVYDATADLFELYAKMRSFFNVIYLVVGVIIGSFIISIINNSILNFQEMKRDLSIIKVLGCKPNAIRRLFWLEMITSFISILLSLFIIIFVFTQYFGPFTLLFGFYIDLAFDWRLILIGLSINIGCFMISYIYYFIGAKRIDVCQEMKS